MQATLSGRCAIVTGAGRGLGQEAACRLAAAGAEIALISRTTEELHQTAATISQQEGTALAIAADISTAAGIATVKAQVEASLGTPTILVNAAGIFGPLQPIATSDPERWIETLTINTVGPYRMCQTFVDGMVSQGWGRIINYSSAAAFHPPGPLVSAYATSNSPGVTNHKFKVIIIVNGCTDVLVIVFKLSQCN